MPSRIALVAGEYILAILSFATVKLILYIFPLHSVANWTTIFSYVPILQAFIVLNFADYQVKQLINRRNELYSEYIKLLLQEVGSKFLFTLPIACGFFIGMFALSLSNKNFIPGLDTNYLLAASLYLVLTDLSIPVSLLRATSRWSSIFSYSLGMSILKISLLAFFLCFKRYYIPFIIISSFQGFIYSAVLSVILIRKIPQLGKSQFFTQLNSFKSLLLRSDLFNFTAVFSSINISIFSAIKALPLALAISYASLFGYKLVILTSLLISITVAISKPFSLIYRKSYNIHLTALSLNKSPEKRSSSIPVFRLFSGLMSGVNPLVICFSLFVIFVSLCYLTSPIVYFLTSGKINFSNSPQLALLLVIVVLIDYLCSLARVAMAAEELYYFNHSSKLIPSTFFASSVLFVNRFSPYFFALLLMYTVFVIGSYLSSFDLTFLTNVGLANKPEIYILLYLASLKICVFLGLSLRNSFRSN